MSKPRYTLTLEGPTGKTVVGEPPSVTEIIKAVFDGSFGPAAWWGMKVAAAALALGKGTKVSTQDLEKEQVLDTYERLKATKITPNTVRDAAGERGSAAHKVAEKIATGELSPEDVFRIYAGDDPDSGYCRAAARWWQDEMPGWSVVGAEVQVYSGALGYVGTFDLLRKQNFEEIVDYKTSKPPARFTQHLQIAAYDLALGSHTVLGRDHRIVMFKPDGTYEQSTLWVDPDLFKPVKEIYDALKAWEQEAK